MAGPGLFGYYGSRNLQSFPVDLDDTACVSFALGDRHPLTASRANEGTIMANRDAFGRFYTWLGLPREGNDIDAVVNANVVCYLGERADMQATSRYLVDTIRSDRASDSYVYYLDDMALYYAVSRAYASGVDSLAGAGEAVVDKIAQRQRRDGSFGDELQTAWAICSLLSFGYWDRVAIEEGAHLLMHRQREDGSWPALAAYLGPAPFYGSEELTTGFALEALARSGA